MSPMGPGTYGNRKGRPPLPRKAPKPPMRPAPPKISATGMTPEMKRKLKEALKKTANTAAKAAKKATKKMGTKTPAKKRKQKYNPYGPGTMNPTKASYGTGP
ncbi:MAG: hypothetical protein CL815_02160 [Coraliomargarita sp.]|nr:hypothetical protein [Coraliomargarita sp.]|tara:strand:+ start:378 stop:683 length:306 start_codon:yes stop_codon:yes gene_type:complete